MFERILITGYSGFVGPWVVAELRRAFPDARLYGAGRRDPGADADRAMPHRQYRLDLRSASQIEGIVTEVRPDAVVHLASLRLAPLDELLAVNVVGTERLLALLGEFTPNARTVVVGSSSELGHVPGLDIPIDEEAPCNPVDFYGITKLAQSTIARRQVFLGQDVVLMRPFNLIGPSMPDSLLGGRCARLLRRAEDAGGPVELEFGPLHTCRDYVDVRDFARAVALALEKSPAGMLYHIGSGTSRSGHELVGALIRESGLQNVSYKAQSPTDPALVPWQTADIARAATALGWHPSISWHQSIRDVLDKRRMPERTPELADLP